MAQFYGAVQGQKGATHRLGSKASGMTVVCMGRTRGVRVVASHNAATGQDEFTIYGNSGSGGGPERCLGVLDAGGRFTPTVRQDEPIAIVAR